MLGLGNWKRWSEDTDAFVMGWKLNLQCFVKTSLDSSYMEGKTETMQLNLLLHKLELKKRFKEDFFEYKLQIGRASCRERV